MITCKRKKKGLRRLKTSKNKKILRGGDKSLNDYIGMILNNEELYYQDIEKIIELFEKSKFKNVVISSFIERLWNDIKEIELLDYLLESKEIEKEEYFCITSIRTSKIEYLNKITDIFKDYNEEMRNKLFEKIGNVIKQKWLFFLPKKGEDHQVPDEYYDENYKDIIKSKTDEIKEKGWFPRFEVGDCIDYYIYKNICITGIDKENIKYEVKVKDEGEFTKNGEYIDYGDKRTEYIYQYTGPIPPARLRSKGEA